MSRTIVTGGAGFIGSHLVDALIAEGREVLIIDDFSTSLAIDRLDPLPFGWQHKQVRVYAHDVRDTFANAIHPGDQIFHLACPASPIWYQRHPRRTLETAIEGTHRALEAAHEHGCRLVVASTSEVYGDPLEHPQKESYCGNVNPLGLRACYEEGKRAAETLCSIFKRSYDVDVRIARIHNTYGPRMRRDDGRVIPSFIDACMKKEPMRIFGDGSQTRSFCYVDDTVRGLMAMMAYNHDLSRPVNIGSTDERTIASVAQAVADHFQVSMSTAVFGELPNGDPKRRQPDIGKAWQLMSWKPNVPFEVGLAATVAWYKDNPIV